MYNFQIDVHCSETAQLSHTLILYIKWKYDVDITTSNIQQCIKCVYDTGQENAQILSYVNMIQELIAARDGFKIIQNLLKNKIIGFIFYISTIDVI